MACTAKPTRPFAYLRGLLSRLRALPPAQGAKPKLQRTLDNVGEVWSKAVIGVTLATIAILPLLGVPLLGPHGALYRAMGVLTAGSPCAVVLVPLAYVCAISTVTRKGVLMKSAAALDLLHQCGTVALDKTGRGRAPGGQWWKRVLQMRFCRC